MRAQGGGINLTGHLARSEDPQRLTVYYTRLFGEPGWQSGHFRGWQLGTDWMDVEPTITCRAATHPRRLSWKTETPTCDFERHEAAAATVVQKPHQPGEAPEGWIATFAGPDDNYFQLVSPM